MGVECVKKNLLFDEYRRGGMRSLNFSARNEHFEFIFNSGDFFGLLFCVADKKVSRAAGDGTNCRVGWAFYVIFY